ncbi:MAG: thermonuclease family protein [Alphaproteobacteria bacterium]
MQRTHPAVLVAAFLLATPASAEELAGPYSADIVRVIDGDTVEARIRVFLGLDLTILVRLTGVDAPELHGKCPGEPDAARAARDYLASLIGSGPVFLSAIRRDKYGGRVLATLHLPSGENAAESLLAAGHAHPATRGRVPRCPR